MEGAEESCGEEGGTEQTNTDCSELTRYSVAKQGGAQFLNREVSLGSGKVLEWVK